MISSNGNRFDADVDPQTDSKNAWVMKKGAIQLVEILLTSKNVVQLSNPRLHTQINRLVPEIDNDTAQDRGIDL
jgi:hypothetical protein